MERGSANQYYRDELSQKFDLIDTSAFEKIGDKYSDIKITYNTTPTSEKFVIYFPEKEGMAVERRVTYEYVYDPIKPEKGNWVIHHQKNTALRDNFGKIAYTNDVSKVLKHFRQTASAARSLKKAIDKEQMNERKLTKAELDKREDIIKDMKKNKRSLVKRYGKDAEKVMYGRATNLAKKQEENMDPKSKIREMVKSALSTPPQVNEKFSKEYDDDPALKGGQKDLPDALQKSIIDKSVKEEEENYKDDPNYSKYVDIGKSYFYNVQLNKPSERDFYLKGRSLTNMEFDDDVEKAYNAIVKDIKLEETVTEDIDLGHEDDEPGMLKSDLYRIGKYAMELYQIMDKLDDGQEVDLPHWWQAKVIKAKDALVSAKHFLDFELKEPQIDQVTDMVDAKGKKYAIDEAMEGKPSQDEVDTFFSETQQEMHYLASKPVEEWDEYDMSNWKSKLKKKELGRPQFSEDIKEKIAEMIKGAHSVMGGKSKKKKKPSKKDIKLAKDTQADYEKSKDEEEDYEGLAARSGASLEETDYKVAGRKVKVIKGKKSDGTDWKVELNGKEVDLSDVLALIEPKPKLTKESTTSTIAEKLAKELKEARAPKTEDELKAAIEDAERKIEKHEKSLSKIGSAPGGGNWSSNSAEGKKSRKLKDAQGKLRDKIDTYTKKLEKLK